MVQKQAALSGGYRADSFADDDPLAELARIVGFEQPRPALREEPELREAANVPSMNLEDELLREFETFEDPRTSRPETVTTQPVTTQAITTEPARTAPIEAAPIAPSPVEARQVRPAAPSLPQQDYVQQSRPPQDFVQSNFAQADFAQQEILRQDFSQPVARIEPPARVEPSIRVEPAAPAPAPLPEPSFDEPLDWAAELAAAEFVEPEPAAPSAPARVEPAATIGQPVRQSVPPAPVPAPAADLPFADLMDELEMAFSGNAPVAAAPVSPSPVTPKLDARPPQPQYAEPQYPEPQRVEPRYAAPQPVVSQPVAPQPAAPSVASASRLSLPLANFQAQPAARREPEPPVFTGQAFDTIDDDDRVEPFDVTQPLSARDERSSAIVSNNLWPELEAAFWTAQGPADEKAEPEQDEREYERREYREPVLEARLAQPERASSPRAAYDAVASSQFPPRTEPRQTEPRLMESRPTDSRPTDSRQVEARQIEPPADIFSDMDFSFAEALAASEDFAPAEDFTPVVEPQRTIAARAPAPEPIPSFPPKVEARREEPAFEPARSAAPSFSSPVFAAPRPVDTSFGVTRSAEPAFGKARQSEPAFGAPRALESAGHESRSMEARVAEQRFSNPPPIEPARSAKRGAEPELAADNDFELMLDDLDLDLSEFDLNDGKSASGGRSKAPAAKPPASKMATGLASLFGARQAAPAPAVATAAVQRPATPPVSEQRLIFDPLDIVETEDHPETIAMPDVPEVAVAEPEIQAPRHQDFEYDLDAELAGLLQAAPPVPAAAAALAPQAAPSAKAASAKPDDFDDFERALEEDFRRSLDQPREGPLRGGRIPINQLTPADAVPEGSRRWMLVASTVALVLVAGAVGAYFWLSGTGSSMIASDEPRVIAANKDPIKVAPENPGGKSVPNQDKAVYDRVGGQNVAAPKQPSLISSNEEPMDVVQRTLMPENLDNDELPPGVSTPVGETVDPRLLPDGQETAAAGPGGEGDQPGISPRKVRTMIVKPDGTLVAQEVPAPATPTRVSPANAGPVTEPAASAPATTAPALAAPSQPSHTPSAAPSQTAAATPAPAAPTQPAAPAASQAATPNAAPVPTTRPSQQPVNVVGTVTDQGNIRGGRVEPAAPAPTQQASAQPAPAAPAAAPASTVPPGDYVIQVASLPSEAEAEKSYRAIASKFSNVVGGRGYEIKAAEVAGKGTYYRVRISGGSKNEADALCARYKSAGGSCLVVR